MTGFLTDLRLAARTLRKEPGFTAIAAGTLALGIAASTSAFSIADAVFFRPLPLAGAERLVRLRDAVTSPDGNRNTFNTRGASLRVIARDATRLEGVIAMRHEAGTLVGGAAPERLHLVGISANLSDGLGIRPRLGREFTRAELADGTVGPALVSDSLWRRRFDGAPSAIGKTLRLDGRTLEVVGVLPPGFRFPYDAEVWVPARMRDDDTPAVFARMKEGVPLAAARAELDALATRLRAEHPELPKTYAFDATPARESLVADEDRIALALAALVVLFLAISSANVASLLLARAVRRRTEFAVRAALGAGRARELRRLLAEGLVLAALAGALGVALSAAAAKGLAVLVPSNLSDQLGMTTVRLEPRVLAFAILVSTLTAAAAALAPGFRTARVDVADALRARGTGASGVPERRLLGLLVIAEIALSTGLLSAAGLLAQEVRSLERADLGIDVDRVATLAAELPARHADAGARIALVGAIEEQLRAVPGVEAAGTLSINPLWGGTWMHQIVPEGGDVDARSGFDVNHRLATPGAFGALGIRVLAGRPFDAHDGAGAPLVVAVSRRLALRVFGTADAVGKRVREFRASGPTPWRTVVAVVSDVKDSGEMKETWYVPYAQEAAGEAAGDLHLFVRGAGAPAALVPLAEKAVWRVDRDLAFSEALPMREGYDRSISREKTGARTVAACASLGVALAALGLFGVLSYAASRRRHEIGVRVALGSSRGAVARLVLGEAARLALPGLALGVAAALAAARLLRAIVADVPAPGAPLLAAVALVLGAASLAAALVPALRATRVDPMVALRTE